MKHPSFIIIGTILLAACAQTPSSGMMDGHGGMGMMDPSRNGNQQDALPGQGADIASLPEATPTQTLEVRDGDTISLRPTLVRKTMNGKQIAMYGYNGQIPGPLLKVKQGSTFTVAVTNGIDMPTTVHWHGIRVANADDGTDGVTQDAIAPGASFRYTVTVPDEGIFWYHTHVREDMQQPMGLYGNVLVEPAASGAYAQVSETQTLTLGDILLDQDGTPVPYGAKEADHALMGRFGNVLLVNGEPGYALDVVGGSVVRFYLTNVANTRTFKIDFGGAKMKLVGGDNGRYERDRYVDSVTLSPSERAIVDVLFDKAGAIPLRHVTPARTYTLGTVTVGNTKAAPEAATAFATLSEHADVRASIDPFRKDFGKKPDHTLVLDAEMGGGRMMMNGHGGMMGDIPEDGIEWEDTMGMMNAGSMGDMIRWKMIDETTGASNKDLVYTAKTGDRVLFRIINKKDSPHPMQHPVHFHGNRFLVLSDNGTPTDDYVWKDTVLVPAGHTVDILLDASNPGDWMFHCHIAEHLSNGMMGMLRIE